MADLGFAAFVWHARAPHAISVIVGPTNRSAPMAGPFEGIRVIDFGRYIAGPYCAALLGALGADVIRVEKREGREDRPRVLLDVGTAFGLEGPFSGRGGVDGVAQALSGMAYFSGTEDQPVRAAAPWVDFGTASLLARGVSAALRAREQTGKGQMVEGALLRTALTFFSPTLIEEDALKINRIPSLNRSQTAGPSDI